MASWQHPPPQPQQTTCTGCMQLSQRVQSLEENVGWLWNQIHQLQKRVPQTPSPWWPSESSLKSPCETSTSTALSPLSVTTAASNITSTPATSALNQSDTPLASPLSDSQIPSQALPEDMEDSEDVELTKDAEIHCPDDSRIFNGFTVAQLKSKARRKQTFSRACKDLFELMFTEEERRGKSLEGYTRKKKDGTVVHRKGLDDQEKLFALQEIIRTEFPDATPRKIKKKLAEKLKPSASTA